MSLRALYDDYFAADPRRSRGMSIGFPLAEWIARTVEERGIRAALDLGSGFSSLLLRSLGIHAVTVDGDEAWLALTRRELERRGMESRLCFTLAEFCARRGITDAGAYDLVLMDLGPIPWRKGVGGALTRVEHAPFAASLVAPDGLLVLDDWHQPGYADAMTPVLLGLGFSVVPLPETLDEFGRFAAVATRASTTWSAECGSWAA